MRCLGRINVDSMGTRECISSPIGGSEVLYTCFPIGHIGQLDGKDRGCDVQYLMLGSTLEDAKIR